MGERSLVPLVGRCQYQLLTYCLGIFAASTTRAQRFDSLTKNSRSCSGELVRASTPSSAKRFCTSGAAIAFASSWLTPPTTPGGVFAGAAIAFHDATS